MKLLLNLKMRIRETLDISFRRVLIYILWLLFVLAGLNSNWMDKLMEAQIDKTTEEIVTDVKNGTLDYYFEPKKTEGAQDGKNTDTKTK